MSELKKYIPRLKKFYIEEIITEMQNYFTYKSIMQVPKIEKITISFGIGDLDCDKKKIDKLKSEVALIAGQMPVVTTAKKSISGFKIREGMPVGIKVTLRGKMMFEFLDRLINIALPRVRDFNGLSNKSFDGKGNFSFGVKEHIIFPEINYDTTDKIRGFNIGINTTAKSDEEAKVLLACFNLPIINYADKRRKLWLKQA